MDGAETIAVAIEDIAELPTAVRQHGSPARADVTGQMCIAVAIALSSYHSN